jgi:hypothetical protein
MGVCAARQKFGVYCLAMESRNWNVKQGPFVVEMWVFAVFGDNARPIDTSIHVGNFANC